MERNRETICDWAARDERFARLRRDVTAQLQRGETSVVMFIFYQF